MITVSWNYTSIERSVEALREDPDAYVIFVEDQEIYDGDSFELSVSDAESLIVKLRNHLDQIYAREAEESRDI